MIDFDKTIPKKIKNSPINKPFTIAIKKLLKEKEVNQFLEENSHLSPIEFIEKIFEELNFDYKVSNSEIENIPTNGRVVIVANHPLAGLDSLALIHLVKKIRKDVKIVANSILKEIKPLKDLILDVDILDKKASKKSISKIIDSLNNEEAVIIFPAGEVSRLTLSGIKDGKWKKGFLQLAKKTKSPILPVFIKAKNSKTFYTISAINKPISSFLLIREIFKQKDKNIELKIGKLIAYEDYASINFKNKVMANLFRKHIYLIGKNKKGLFKTQNPIAHPENKILLKEELKNATLLGKTNDNKSIYLFTYSPDSPIMREIGRLREVSFRKVGEGSGHKRDIDKYDTYYKHIILWDEENLEIIGSYRIAEGEFVYKNYSKEGFYTNTLFEYNDNFIPILQKGIELGRSFIQPKYWNTRALDYLWQGIGKYLKANPNIKYLFGPVSISNMYPKFAQNLIIYFYKNYYSKQSNLVSPKNPFIITKEEEKEIKEFFDLNNKKEDFLKLRNLLKSQHLTIPTLYKQYPELFEDEGIDFVSFNVDENFNCVDSFIVANLDYMKEKKKKRYIN
ncbi:GNAT family N-acetyltransferase [Caminibacter mediatlanticus TB-2]|uniref:GNAT family N-acetyltransferase n=1 Tax=Caminibacter mediatlanticus TB-2 TaxID=391592 RepID=A0AAI9AHE3_9BACT|nr:lysophospholipid acyltransferase family protein [Caminibacter mediatlanticus]EDM23550.1 putative hemolysin [Caminibacter mediatlanticus TB-2]QCT94119.1 GNAT family N-acetyltransferase [Caminibacter mediatlanticus TB-2]